MKRKFSFLITYWWCLLLGLLGLLVFITGNREGGVSELENRTLEPLPAFSAESWFDGSFAGSLEAYPISDSSTWTPGVLEADTLPAQWQYAYDTSAPTCRLLNMPYDPTDEATQFYVIDGFIVSPNVEITSVETLDLQFHASDHNPVLLEAKLN